MIDFTKVCVESEATDKPDRKYCLCYRDTSIRLLTTDEVIEFVNYSINCIKRESLLIKDFEDYGNSICN